MRMEMVNSYSPLSGGAKEILLCVLCVCVGNTGS